MKTITRYGVAATALLTVAPLAACSSDAGSAPGSNKIAVVVASTKQDFGKEMMGGFVSGAQEVGGVDVLATGTDIVDGPKQVQIFNDVTKTHTGGITLFTITPDLFAEPLAKAGEENIPLIAMDTPPPPSSNVDLLIANDNVQLGRQLADTLADDLPRNSKGTIVIGTKTPGAQVLDQRAQGMREQFAKRLPGVTVLGPIDTKQENKENMNSWRLLVRTNPKALAFVGTGDQDAMNLATIRQQTKAKWLAGGVTSALPAVKAVKSGDLVIVSAEHWTKGMVAGRLQAQHATTGKKLPTGWIVIPGLVITKDNVGKILERQSSESNRNAWSRPMADRILSDTKTYLRAMPEDAS